MRFIKDISFSNIRGKGLIPNSNLQLNNYLNIPGNYVTGSQLIKYECVIHSNKSDKQINPADSIINNVVDEITVHELRDYIIDDTIADISTNELTDNVITNVDHFINNVDIRKLSGIVVKIDN